MHRDVHLMPSLCYALGMTQRTIPMLLLLSGVIIGLLFVGIPAAFAAGSPILGTLHAGKRPEALAVDTQTHLLYIANEGSGTVAAFDPLTGRLLWSMPVGDIVTDIQVDSTTHRVFATTTTFQQHHQSHLVILNGATGQILFSTRSCTGDNSLTLDSVLQRVFEACTNNGMITIFTFTSGWQSGPVQVMTSQLKIGSHPDAVAVNRNLHRLYVADRALHTLFVLDENTDKTLATIDVGAVPLPPMRVDEATNRLYVVCSTAQALYVINGTTNSILARVPVGPYPEGLAIHSATGRIYVADEGDNEQGHGSESGTTITAIDSRTFAVLGTLQVGAAPDGLASDAALHRLYVADENSDAVVEIDDTAQLPLLNNSTFGQQSAAQQAVGLLHLAALLTASAMLLTFMGATLYALLRRWRARESPRTAPDDVSSRSPTHSPLP